MGEVVRAVGAPPGLTVHALSMMFHRGQFRDDLCPIVGGKRRVPASYLPMVRLALKRAGKLPADTDLFAPPA